MAMAGPSRLAKVASRRGSHVARATKTLHRQTLADGPPVRPSPEPPSQAALVPRQVRPSQREALAAAPSPRQPATPAGGLATPQLAATIGSLAARRRTSPTWASWAAVVTGSRAYRGRHLPPTVAF